MKALIYKEFKLSMHPMCYVFMFAFPLMVLIPSFPLGIGSIYILSAYPILFLGANKGQQSNDLLYSTLLPVRKKDIVLARIITVMVMQFAFLLLEAALTPLANIIQGSISTSSQGAGPKNPGIGTDGIVSLIALSLLGYGIADLIFFPIYYKKGRSIVMSTLLMILGYVLYIGIFTIALPMIPGCEWYLKIMSGSGYGVQFIILGVVLALDALIHFLVYKISAKRLENVDF